MKVLSVGLSFLLFFYPLFPAGAQFLRLGPFDFFAKTGLEGVYTTNVEQERPSEQTAEAEDYYLIWRLDLASTAQMMPRTELSIRTGIAIEEHLNRTDLNNSEAPFGYVDARFLSDWEPLFVYGGYLWERTSESTDDLFIPAGFPDRKKRQVGTTSEAEIGTDWIQDYYELGVSYTFTQERYDDDEFSFEENDEHNINYYLRLKPFQRASIRYENDLTKTIYINRPGEDEKWEGQEEVTVDFLFDFWERPRITYSIGVQNEVDENGFRRGWEYIHTLNISDKYQLGPRLDWAWYIIYDYEQSPEPDDISLEYGAIVNHQLADAISHSFSASQSPVDTLGSTEDTKETSYQYILRFQDVFMPGLSVVGSVENRIDEPVIGDTERTRIYDVIVAHTAQLNNRLSRKIAYEYNRESSNLIKEILDEHRVTLSFYLEL